MKRGLYDAYKMAIRWASDRIGDRGVIAVVTNGSWIDGNVDSGVRACLVEEFSSVWVLNLRGNQRTSGERSRREGGKVFGSGSRAPVAITVLVRNPDAGHDGCRILYRDIGDYLKREQKLDFLREMKSTAGVPNWREITSDRHNDWIRQRDPAFQRLFPLGTAAAKAGKSDDAVFRLFSNGYKTSRDAYIYNFDSEVCEANARAMVGEYMGAVLLREANPARTIDDAVSHHSSRLRWDANLKVNLKRGLRIDYSGQRICAVSYRPFVKQHGYIEYILANSKYQQDKIFPPDTQGVGTHLATADRRLPTGR